jgi:hypothetical protein
MTTSFASSLGGIPSVADESRAERAPRAELDSWAATLAATLAQKLPPPVVQPLNPDTTGSWRQSVGALTPGSEATPGGQKAAQAQAAAGTASGTGETTNEARVHLSTHIADLGEIAVVVDRSARGVTVTIGVEDARAAMLIDPERVRLQGALVAAGVGVDSIKVIQLDRRGTLLASPKNTVPRALQGSDSLPDGERNKRSRGRKVDIVG